MNYQSLFEKNGNILLRGFIKDSNFNEICEKLKKDNFVYEGRKYKLSTLLLELQKIKNKTCYAFS